MERGTEGEPLTPTRAIDIPIGDEEKVGKKKEIGWQERQKNG